MKKLLLAFLAVIIVAVFWYEHSLQPLNPNDQTGVIVSIPAGSGLRQIATILQGKKLIRSSLAFQLHARFAGIQRMLQAGTYVFRPSQSVTDIMTVLRQGFSEQVIVTIPEGFTVKDIDALLASKGLMESGAFLACARMCDFSSFNFLSSYKGLASRGGKLEGYLFPDTYYVEKADFQPKDFLNRLLTTFQMRVVVGLASDLKASGHSLNGIMTMASLIEEESRDTEERPVVAGILWKRFNAHQILGVDAAVRYIVGKPTGVLTEKDLQIDSPYNLRKVIGLPPGPITNPSLSSIEAALHPRDSSYWYYLHGTDGVIHYAVTNEEHNRNRVLYLR